jgi:uncharacterized protein YbbC (DUF1343 family)
LVKTGLESLIANGCGILGDARVGLITNRSSITKDGIPGYLALFAHGVNIKALFAPEHGLSASLPAGEPVGIHKDETIGAVVFSLYGDTFEPSSEMLDEVDVVVFDMQDVGARFYTYITTMLYSMYACARAGKPFIVLDRPNPIGGLAVEGTILESGFESMVGELRSPIRFGLTIGEAAVLAGAENMPDLDLRVEKLEGWKRAMWFDETGLPWVPTSPNLSNIDALTVYPGMCLLEGTNLSEGRGTDSPFLAAGAPWINASEMVSSLSCEGLPGVVFEPVEFVPTRSKYAGERCSGVRLVVTDRNEFRPVLTAVAIIAAARDQNLEHFEFIMPKAGGRLHFDLLAGTDRLRNALESGAGAWEIASEWDSDVSEFRRRAMPHLLYEPETWQNKF